MVTETVTLPAWFIVFSTIFLMICASIGEYQRGYLQGKEDEFKKHIDDDQLTNNKGG